MQLLAPQRPALYCAVVRAQKRVGEFVWGSEQWAEIRGERGCQQPKENEHFRKVTQEYRGKLRGGDSGALAWSLYSEI